MSPEIPREEITYNFKSAFLITTALGIPELAATPIESHEPLLVQAVDTYANHAGNIGWGGSIAFAGIALYGLSRLRKRGSPAEGLDDILTFPSEDIDRLRARGTALIMGVTAVANATTETKWGVRYLPFDELLNGPVADPWDAISSTITAGVMANLFWHRSRSGAAKQ